MEHTRAMRKAADLVNEVEWSLAGSALETYDKLVVAGYVLE